MNASSFSASRKKGLDFIFSRRVLDSFGAFFEFFRLAKGSIGLGDNGMRHRESARRHFVQDLQGFVVMMAANRCSKRAVILPALPSVPASDGCLADGMAPRDQLWRDRFLYCRAFLETPVSASALRAVRVLSPPCRTLRSRSVPK